MNGWLEDTQVAAEEARRRAAGRAFVRDNQREVALEMKADGHTTSEIAERTGLSPYVIRKLLAKEKRRTQ